MTRTVKGDLIASRYWIAGVAVFVGLCTAMYYVRNPPAYSSTVSFFVGGYTAQAEDNEDIRREHRTNIVNLYHMARSTAMFEHLNRTFGLATHFGLDTTDAQFDDRLHAFLSSSISVGIHQYDAVEVTVTDRNRSLAARMANELFMELRRMNEALVMEELERTITTYDQVIANVTKDVDDRSMELLALAERIRAQDRPFTKPDQDVGRSVAMDHQLVQMAAGLNAGNADLVRTKQKHEMLAALLSTKDYSDVKLKQRAFEDLETDLFGTALRNTLLFALGSALVVVMVILMIHSERDNAVDENLGEENFPRKAPRVVVMQASELR
jgi:uncharacterized protein involved in exopolysaccharide biosynthesis